MLFPVGFLIRIEDDIDAKILAKEHWDEMTESPHLSEDVLRQVRVLLEGVRAELNTIASGDTKTLHHARRYVMKRLEFDERSSPAARNKLKLTLMAKQQGKCTICGEPLPPRDSELDRKDPVLGYIEENCTLIHRHCHRKAQAAKHYA